MAKNTKALVVPDEVIMNKIILIRGIKVMIDRGIAAFYGVSTKRFPADFMFQLTAGEKEEVAANCDHLRNLKYSPGLPFAFTEHGAVMLAGVLNSEKAIATNIQVIRVFTKKINLEYKKVNAD